MTSMRKVPRGVLVLAIGTLSARMMRTLTR
jgi:hypothetical protein